MSQQSTQVEPYHNPEPLHKILEVGQNRKVTIQQVNSTNIDDFIDRLAPFFQRYTMFYRMNQELEQCRTFLLRRSKLTGSTIFFAFLHPETDTSTDGDEASPPLSNLTPIGFAQIHPTWTSTCLEENHILNDLFIDEEYRELKIGHKLIQTVLEWGETTGACFIRIETSLNNPRAQHLYPKLGFIEQYRLDDSIYYKLKYPKGQARVYPTFYE